MFSFLKELYDSKSFLRETERVETTENMNVSKRFLDVLQLSFEMKHLNEDNKSEDKLSEKKNKIEALEDKMNALYDSVIDVSMNSTFDDVVALAAAHYNLGIIYARSLTTNELNSAVACFSRCLQLLKGKQLDPKAILTSITALNQINSVCNQLEEKKYTFQFLITALELYTKYTVQGNFRNPVNIATIVDIKEEKLHPRLLLDFYHHRTLRDLGIQYVEYPKDKHVFVTYMYNVLQIQLEKMLEKERFEAKFLNWALTLYELCRFFVGNNRFIEAKNHTVTADYVVYRCYYDDELNTIKKKSDSSCTPLYDRDYVCAISAATWGFEQQRIEQIKLHKQRIECLEDICKELHSTSNVVIPSNVYRRIYFELVTSSSMVIDLMFEEAFDNDSYGEMIRKIDRFAKLISKNIDLYVNT